MIKKISIAILSIFALFIVYVECFDRINKSETQDKKIEKIVKEKCIGEMREIVDFNKELIEITKNLVENKKKLQNRIKTLEGNNKKLKLEIERMKKNQ